MYLENEFCIIDLITVEDVKAASYLMDQDVMRYIEPVFDEEKIKCFFKTHGIDQQHIYALRTKSHALIGHVIFHPYDDTSYEIGWVIDKNYWNKGYASHSLALLEKELKRLGRRSLLLETHQDNASCFAFAKKHGFVFLRREEELLLFTKTI